MNDMDQTEFDFSENQETEQERLEREVLAAGGKAGKKEGRFVFDYEEGQGYKRGDEHPVVAGLYFWRRGKHRGTSFWFSLLALEENRAKASDDQKNWHESNPEYRQEYLEENRDKIAQTSKRWREANKDKEAERQKRYREENRERVDKNQRRWVEANKQRLVEYRREYREENKERISNASKKWYKENKERRAEASQKWERDNHDKRQAITARRRAKLREALDPNANQAIIDSRYGAAHYLREVTGIEWHVDHTVPISKGGKHHEDNLQVVPQSWNNSKCNTHNDRWIEDSNIYRYATAVEKRFEEEAKKSKKK